MTLARRALIAGAILWVGLLWLAPLGATQSSPGHLLYVLAIGVYSVGRFICHQLPERSFYLWTAQLPVCARCTGIYVGGALAAIVAATRPAWVGDDAPRAAAASVGLRPKSKRGHRGWQPRPQPIRTSAWQVMLERLGMDSVRARVVLAVAALPTVLTLVYEWTTGDRPSNMLRAVSGTPLGAAIMVILIAALSISPSSAGTPALAGRRVN
jgi:hypothetical protein